MNKKLFLFVAATAALASCSDELTLEQTNGAIANQSGIQGKLVKAGFIGGGVAADETRAVTGKGSFVWMASSVHDGTVTVGEIMGIDPSDPEYVTGYHDQLVPEGTVYGDYPQIGLCWTGVNVINPSDGAVANAGDNVFTNYLYDQVGWMQNGEKVLDYDECTDQVYNGAFYIGSGYYPEAHFAGPISNSISPNNAVNAGVVNYGINNSLMWAPVTSRYNKYYYSDENGVALGEFDWEDPLDNDEVIDNPNAELNLGGGIFKTENSSVFEGQYIVYFPYNADFKRGPIMAKVGTEFSMDVADDKYAVMSENAFQLGVIKHYQGILAGRNREASFTTKNYSATAQVRLYNTGSTRNVRAVVLYSPTTGIIYEQGLKASTILDGYNSGDMKKIEEIEGTKSHVHSVYTYLTDSKRGVDYAEVNQANQYSAAAGYKIVFPVLPQTIEKLSVIVMLDDCSTLVSEEIASLQFDEGGNKNIDINVATLKNNGYIAFDEPSLLEDMKVIWTGNVEATENTNPALNKPIKLLRDINLESVNDDYYTSATFGGVAFPKGELKYRTNVDIIADASTSCPDPECNGASLIVKANKNVQTVRDLESYNSEKKLTIKVPVIVEGTGCCSDKPAVLNIGGKDNTNVDQITFTESLTNYGNTNVGEKNGNKTNVKFAEVTNSYDDNYVTEQGYSKGSYLKNKAIANAETDTYSATEHGKYNAVFNIYANTDEDFAMIDGHKVMLKTTADKLVNYGFVNVNSAKKLATADNLGQRSLKVEITEVVNKGVAKGSTAFDAAVADGATVDLLNKVVGGEISVSENALVTIKKIDNANEFSYVHTLGVGKSATTDARIDVTDAGNSQNLGTWENDGVSNFLGGKLDNTDGLLIDKLNGQIGGKPINNGGEPENDWEYIKIAKTDTSSEPYDLEDYSIRYYRGAEEKSSYQTDLNTGIYVAQVKTNERLAFLVNDAVEQKSVNIIEILGQNHGGYDLSAPEFQLPTAYSLGEFDVMINYANINIMAQGTSAAPWEGEAVIGHCLDVQKPTLKLTNSNKLTVVKNFFVRENTQATNNNGYLEVGGNMYVEEAAVFQAQLPTTAEVLEPADVQVKGSLIVDETGKASLRRPIDVKIDVAAGGTFQTINTDPYNPIDAYFSIHNSVLVGKDGTFHSTGTPNVVENNYALYGDADFARYTTTKMGVEKEGAFDSYVGSTFERKQLGSDDVYRATVNVYNLNSTNGTTNTGWPTEIPQL